jgi:hypothetical protein
MLVSILIELRNFIRVTSIELILINFKNGGEKIMIFIATVTIPSDSTEEWAKCSVEMASAPLPSCLKKWQNYSSRQVIAKVAPDFKDDPIYEMELNINSEDYRS